MDTTGRRRRIRHGGAKRWERISQVVDDQRIRVHSGRTPRPPVGHGNDVNPNGSRGCGCRLLIGAQSCRELIGMRDESGSRTTHDRQALQPPADCNPQRDGDSATRPRPFPSSVLRVRERLMGSDARICPSSGSTLRANLAQCSRVPSSRN